MDGSPDLQTGFNLVLCYYAAGEKERMKKGFSRLLSVRLGVDDDALESDFDDVLQESCSLDDSISTRSTNFTRAFGPAFGGDGMWRWGAGAGGVDGE